MRVLKLKLMTQTSLVKVETSVSTFGEFKELPEVKDLKIDWKSTKLMNKSDHTTYEVDSARLPVGDSIMFVVPTKSKSGLTDADIDNMGYKEAKEAILAKGIKISWMGKTASDLRQILKDNNEEVVVEPEVTIIAKGVKVNVVEHAVVTDEEIEDELDIEEDLDIVDYTTGEELDSEAEALKKELSK